jgi:hypothetical protein
VIGCSGKEIIRLVAARSFSVGESIQVTCVNARPWEKPNKSTDRTTFIFHMSVEDV